MGVIPGMSSLATGMMKKKIDKANIPSLEELQEVAQLEGVQLIACKMTVDMMEIDEDKLIDGVIVWTAEDFLKYARGCTTLPVHLIFRLRRDRSGFAEGYGGAGGGAGRMMP